MTGLLRDNGGSALRKWKNKGGGSGGSTKGKKRKKTSKAMRTGVDNMKKGRHSVHFEGRETLSQSGRRRGSF